MATKVANPRYICKKYGIFFYISILLVGFQLFLAYNFYSVGKIEESKNFDVLADKDKQEVIDRNHIVRPDINNILDAHNQPVIKDNTSVFPLDRRKQMIRSLREKLAQSNHSDKNHEMCDVVGKDAISAINRASTDTCKQEITETYCDLRARNLYPLKLQRSCSLQGTDQGEYVGCYRDNRQERVLSGPRSEFKNTNAPMSCINHCLRIGFEFAGVEFGFECFCGNDYPQSRHQLQKSECDMHCPGDSSQQCGGFLTVNIYKTGLGGRANNPSDYISPENVDSPNVRIVFMLTVNGRALRQIKRLLKAIYHERHYYYIHVDKRQDYLHRELTAISEIFPGNVRLSQARFATIWGGASLLSMHLQCMKELLAMTDWNWDFFLNLSESDYPIKRLVELEAYLAWYPQMNFVRSHSSHTLETLRELMSYLSVHKQHNFLRSHGKDTTRFIRKQGLNMLFHECDTHMWRLGERPLQNGIRIDGGSDWFCLNREFANYVVHGDDELLQGLHKYWKYSLLPAESFFHTVLHNSHFCTSWVNNNLHLTNWRRKQGCKCQYKHIVDWCGCSPNDFKTSDLPKLKSTEKKPTYFARKFEAIVHQRIIGLLDSYLYGHSQEGQPGFDSYWQSEYHYLDASHQVDESHFSLYHSLTRLVSSSPSLPCVTQSTTLQEITVYNAADQFQGLLAKIEVTFNTGSSVIIESLLQPINFNKILKPHSPVSRLVSIQVGTNFDPKEEILRNYGSIVGPNSALVVRIQWSAGRALPFTICYVDPAGIIAGTYEVPVKESTHDLIQVHKPEFAKPLRPGFWQILVIYMWETVAETKFLVLPISYPDMNENNEELFLLHNGPPSNKYTDKDYSYMLNYLPQLSNDSAANLRKAEDSAKLYGSKLDIWVDSLVRQAWSVSEVCVLSHSLSCPVLHSCNLTQWSSFSPDPKSAINGVDPVTGTIR